MTENSVHANRRTDSSITTSTEAARIDMRRLIGTTAEGTFVCGGLGYFWYRWLDAAVKRIGCKPGTLRFVAAKLGMEVAIWHPFSLAAFWVILGVWNGNPPRQIKEELQKEFLPTLASEVTLWTTLDILNFWKVPVRFQVLVANLGGLLEAVGLSYVHEHGFPGIPSRIPEKSDPGIMHGIAERLHGLERFQDS
jgi:protein Mpv17